MFFTRLRTHAKWVFVVLAAAFAIGFLAFGVGAGGTGFGDAIADFFGGDDTPTLEEARAKVEKNPRDADALLELANVYEGRRDYAAAAETLERYLELRPDDVDVMRQLATVYGTRAQQIEAERSLLSSYTGPGSFQASVFAFPDSSGFIGAVGQDPIAEAKARAVSQRMAALRDDIEAAYGDAARVYEQITKVTPNDPEAFLELGAAAAAAGENDKAIEAYERFLELDPESNQADQIREQIDLLQEDVRVVNG